MNIDTATIALVSVLTIACKLVVVMAGIKIVDMILSLICKFIDWRK